MFAPAQLLDPLRVVQGTDHDRYDCPDLAALDRHISRLRRRMTDLSQTLSRWSRKAIAVEARRRAG